MCGVVSAGRRGAGAAEGRADAAAKRCVAVAADHAATGVRGVVSVGHGGREDSFFFALKAYGLTLLSIEFTLKNVQHTFQYSFTLRYMAAALCALR